MPGLVIVLHARGRFQGHALRLGLVPVLSLEAELEQGDNQCEQETPDQDVEDPGHIAQRQLVPGRVLFVVATLGPIVPPFVLQPRQLPVLEQS